MEGGEEQVGHLGRECQELGQVHAQVVQLAYTDTHVNGSDGGESRHEGGLSVVVSSLTLAELAQRLVQPALGLGRRHAPVDRVLPQRNTKARDVLMLAADVALRASGALHDLLQQATKRCIDPSWLRDRLTM